MRYKFNREISTKLNKFDKYLRSNQYSLNTIRQHKNYTGIYLSWLEQEVIKVEDVDYKTFTPFIFQLKTQHSLGHTRRIILAVRHYYDYLDLGHNPASGIYIRGGVRSVLNKIVFYQELETLYQEYQVLDDRGRRNKVILGIMIYQALTTSELHQLEPSHIKLKEGKIYVPGTPRTVKRVLSLNAVQLLELQEYLLIIRPRMLAKLSAVRSRRRVEHINPIIYDRLFFSEHGNDNIKNSLYHMFRALRRKYPKVTSGNVIRSTVIAEWLKTRDIRIVQYMAGHRWVSSTERYNVFNLQELKDSLNKYHPLK